MASDHVRRTSLSVVTMHCPSNFCDVGVPCVDPVRKGSGLAKYGRHSLGILKCLLEAGEKKGVYLRVREFGIVQALGSSSILSEVMKSL